jgi:uncharacterized protein with beta-barrel porin domain
MTGPSVSSVIESPIERATVFASNVLSSLNVYNFNLLTTPEQQAVARQLMPGTVSSGSSTSSQSSISASGMVFDKAGTFTGDLTGMRSTQARLTANEQRDFKALISGMRFSQMAESLSVAPIAFRSTNFKSYGVLDGAKASKYDLLTPGEISGWVQGNVSQNRLRTVGTTVGSISNGASIIGAVERAMTQDTLLGVMYSRTESDSKMLEDAGSLKSQQNMFGFYGQKLLGDLKLTGILTMGRNSYDSSRKILSREVALGKYEGSTTQVSLGASNKFDYQDIVIEPFILAAYTVNKTDPFQETGAPNFGLSVGATRARDFTVTLGSVLTHDAKLAGYPAKLKFKPALRLNQQVQAADAAIAVGGGTTGVSAGRTLDKATPLFAGELQVHVSKSRIWRFGADVEKSTNASYGRLFAQYEMKFQ